MSTTLIIILIIVVVFVVISYLLVGKFKPVAPEIIKLEEPLKMVGISVKTNQKMTVKDAANLGKEYKQIKDKIINN